YEAICDTFNIHTRVVESDNGLAAIIGMPRRSENPVEDDFLDEYSLWSTFQIAETISHSNEISSVPLHHDPDQKIILIIEDNQEVGKFLAKSLENEYRIVQAFNGFDGLRKAVTLIPDIILSDIHMPGVSGIEVARLIKNDEKTSHIPIVLITADAFEANKIRAIESGADEILIKPVSLKELRVRIATILKKKRRFFKAAITGQEVDTEGTTIIKDKFLEKLDSIMNEHFGNEDLSVEELGELVGMSLRQLQRKIKAVTGRLPNGYIRYYRLQRAKEMIRDHKMSVSEAAYASGFSNLSYFAKCFKDEFGELPSNTN
ncbi:MAG: DNA-binding response regulator, partial [Chlorobiota bacterium]